MDYGCTICLMVFVLICHCNLYISLFFCNALLMTSLSLLQWIDLNEWRQNRIKTALYSELE